MVTSPISVAAPAAGAVASTAAASGVAVSALPIIPVLVGGAVSIAAIVLIWKLIDSIKSEDSTEDAIEVKVDKNVNVEIKRTKSPARMNFITTKEQTIASAPTSDLKDPTVSQTFKTCMAAALVAMLVNNGMKPKEAHKIVFDTMDIASKNQSQMYIEGAASTKIEGKAVADKTAPSSE